MNQTTLNGNFLGDVALVHQIKTHLRNALAMTNALLHREYGVNLNKLE